MNKQPEKSIRVRIAPSPTGLLHVGTARTALFNWLFAKKQGGTFIVRVEDTDTERSKKEYEENILEGLKWLGLDWDEGPDGRGDYGPYRQSERAIIYKKYITNLLEKGHAYYCFCTKEELEVGRASRLAEGYAPKYSGKCRGISKEEAEKRRDKGETSVIRFKIPESKIQFNDLIRGTVTFDMVLVGDIVIAKNLEMPLYNFAVTIDDHEMKISHVIRGEDHIANTPKQIAFQSAMGLETPQYAHLPLILAPNRSKLSKRDLETSLDDYRKEGYLPEAILNFIALIGWHPMGDRELLTQKEMIEEFDITRVQKAGAIFAVEKLDWLNSQYIKSMPVNELKKRMADFIPNAWHKKEDVLIKSLTLEQGRIKKLSEFKDTASFFFELPPYDIELLSWPKGEKIDREKISERLTYVVDAVSSIQEKEFTQEVLSNALMPFAEKEGRGEVLWPLRVSVSGQQSSPGPFEIMETLGKSETLSRISSAIKNLE